MYPSQEDKKHRSLNLNVPVIDLRTVDGKKGSDASFVLAQDIGDACKEWGFFQIINHGITKESMETRWKAVHKFFALPKTEKRTLTRSNKNPWGFFDQELTKNQRDKKEVFDISPFNIPKTTNENDPFLGQTPWPESCPEFEALMHQHFMACTQISLKILRAICVSLGFDQDHLTDYFIPDHTSFLRLNYYPVKDLLTDTDHVTDKEKMGVHHHTDSGALTILCQENIKGLQVLKDNRWYSIDPVPDAFVINIGDMVQVWSNDKYKAPLHRVLAMTKTDRYSIPFFFNPSYATNVTPLTKDSGTKKYHDINWGEFRKKRADGDYANIGKEVQIDDYLI